MAILMSTGTRAKRSTILYELQALLARISQSDDGRMVRFPEQWRYRESTGGVGYIHLPWVPGLGRVMALRIAVHRLESHEPFDVAYLLEHGDTTILGAVKRLHQSDVEIHA